MEDGSVASEENMVKWRTFMDNAKVFFQKRQLDKAEKLYQAALLEAKEEFGPRDSLVGVTLCSLADFYRQKEEYEKAERLHLEAIEILEESFGSNHIWVGLALCNLGICYHFQGKLAQAQTCYERALKIQGCAMGVGHPRYARTMYLLAQVLSLQGKRKNGEYLAEESIRILEEAGLSDSPTCIERKMYLQSELMKSKRYADAEILARKILHTLELSKGWDSLDTIRAAEVLSSNLTALGMLKEPEELLERCLAVKKKVLPEDNFQVAGTLVKLANLTLEKISSYGRSERENVNGGVVAYYLSRAKQLINETIRITEGILNSSSKDQNKLDKIAATLILLEALDDVAAINLAEDILLPPGLVLLLRLPLLHGFFKIDTVHISNTSPSFIWPGTTPKYVSYTTLRIHFKNGFGKEQEYMSIEDALHKCISLYKEPHTREFVLVPQLAKQNYMERLRGLIHTAELKLSTQEAPELLELLGEARQILKEL